MSDTVSAVAIDWTQLLGSTPLEVVATLCAVVGVFLIARQNILGWSLGIVWAGISTGLAFGRWHLVSDGILYAAYIPIQAYCWWLWARRGAAGADAPFTPSWLSKPAQFGLAFAAAASIGLWGLGVTWLAAHVSWIPEPSLLWRDSTTTVLNFYAQFLQARKRMENWVGWLIVNLLSIHIYWVKDSPIYAIQYAFFLILGIYGWVQWHRSMKRAAPRAAAAGDTVRKPAARPARLSGVALVAVLACAVPVVAEDGAMPASAPAADARGGPTVEPELAPEEAAPAGGATLTLGYDSRYILYGYRLSRHLYHADVALYRGIGDRVSLWAGAWYGYLTDGTYNEVDVYAGVDVSLGGGFSVGAGYSLFNYLEVPFPTSDRVSEIAVQAVYTAGPLTLKLRDQYDFQAEGHLLRAIGGLTGSLAERVSFDFAAEFGYAFGYYIEGNQPNHALFTLRIPVRVSDRVQVVPFVARSLALDAIDAFERDDTYGGCSIVIAL